MKKDNILDKEFLTRKEEEEVIKEYINDFFDLDSNEYEKIVQNLDIQTIKAFELAMENVASEYERDKSKTEILINHIKDCNNSGEIVSLKELKLNPPEGLDAQSIEQILSGIEETQQGNNIVIIKGKEDYFLYDSSLWTGQYAMTAVLLKEKDILEVIAQRVRIDCKIYPRPLQVTALKVPPYDFTEEEIINGINKMKSQKKYSDINTVTASNGGICIYSSDHMSEKYAKALCEDLEVEWKKQQ